LNRSGNRLALDNGWLTSGLPLDEFSEEDVGMRSREDPGASAELRDSRVEGAPL
jgi:hypothetical protein